MSCSFVMKNLLCKFTDLHIILCSIESKDRSKLLIGIWMSKSNAGLFCNQNSCSFRNLNLSQICDHLGTLTNDLRIHGSVCSKDEFSKFCDLLIIQEISSLFFHLDTNGRFHITVAHNRLLGCTDRSIVKSL